MLGRPEFPFSLVLLQLPGHPRVALFRLPSFQALEAPLCPCYPFRVGRPGPPSSLCFSSPPGCWWSSNFGITPLHLSPLQGSHVTLPWLPRGFPELMSCPASTGQSLHGRPLQCPHKGHSRLIAGDVQVPNTPPIPPRKPLRRMQRYLWLDSRICKLQTPLQKHSCQRHPVYLEQTPPSQSPEECRGCNALGAAGAVDTASSIPPASPSAPFHAPPLPAPPPPLPLLFPFFLIPSAAALADG